ncbi:MAG: caspase family protein [Saprospiraceae bacterium]|nr:caspase family protein [Saprospiraceae bacterium]
MNTNIFILCGFLFSLELSAQVCLRGNCIQGFGTMSYADGSRYTGEFRSGLREGKGIYYYQNQNKYLGEWQKDARHGEGKMEFANGDVYTGQFNRNFMEGKGTMEFGRGDKYFGDWKSNKPHGKGSYYFKTGERYEGDFENALFTGYGTLYYKSGAYYSGQWKSSKKHGSGEFHDASGKIVAAEWDTDKMVHLNEKKQEPQFEPTSVVATTNQQQPDHKVVVSTDNSEKIVENPKPKLTEEDEYFDKIFGSAQDSSDNDVVEDNSDVDRFFGDVPREMQKTEEKVQERTESSKEQQVEIAVENKVQETPPAKVHENPAKPSALENNQENESDLPDCNLTFCESGRGVFKYADGSKYVGSFRDGEPVGSGTCYYSNGDRYEGEWSNHAPHGEGIMYFTSGLIYGAIWDQGKAVKELSRRKEFIFDAKVPVDYSKEVKIWAVIIGIARYEHMPVLKYSDDDAYKIYAFLKSPEGGALKDQQVKVLIDEDANRNAILTALNQVFLRADENDVVMLYYSGHGLEGTFLPIDYDGIQNILKHDEVKDIINKSRAKNKICFIDACHSGSVLAQKGSFSSSLMHFYEDLAQSKGGTAFVMSSKSKEYSLEDGGLRQGVFSHFLIRGLKGEADSDGDETIVLKELFEYIYKNVREYTGNVQTPMIAGDYDEFMPVGFVRE